MGFRQCRSERIWRPGQGIIFLPSPNIVWKLKNWWPPFFSFLTFHEMFMLVIYTGNTFGGRFWLLYRKIPIVNKIKVWILAPPRGVPGAAYPLPPPSYGSAFRNKGRQARIYILWSVFLVGNANDCLGYWDSLSIRIIIKVVRCTVYHIMLRIVVGGGEGRRCCWCMRCFSTQTLYCLMYRWVYWINICERLQSAYMFILLCSQKLYLVILAMERRVLLRRFYLLTYLLSAFDCLSTAFRFIFDKIRWLRNDKAVYCLV